MTDPKENENSDFASMLAQFEAETGQGQNQNKHKKRRELTTGDQVKGRIVSIGRESAFVAVGGKSEGMLDLQELRDSEGKLTVKVGDEIEARVAEYGANGLVLKRMAGRASDAGELRSAYELQLPIEGKVVAVNKGGLEVEIGRARAFCPLSQIDLRPVEDAAALIGQKLQFRITKLEMNGNRLNLVVSRRVILEAEQRVRLEAIRGQLIVGAVVHGRVTSVRDYGAFVDLGGIEGLLHKSELGFRRVDHPSEMLTVGQEIDVAIVKIERDEQGKERFALSVKSLEADPWATVQERYFEGVKAKGTIRRLESFGAFVELEPGVEGLIHISEIGGGRRIKHPKDVLTAGESAEVVVLQVDFEKRRIALGLPGQVETADAETDADEGGGGAQSDAAPAKQKGEKRAAAAAAPAPATTNLGTFGDLLSKATDKADKKKK